VIAFASGTENRWKPFSVRDHQATLEDVRNGGWRWSAVSEIENSVEGAVVNAPWTMLRHRGGPGHRAEVAAAGGFALLARPESSLDIQDGGAGNPQGPAAGAGGFG